MSPETFLNSVYGKKLPNWFLLDPVWKSINDIKKIFPLIGLKNNIERDYIDLEETPSAIYYCKSIPKGKYHIAFSSNRCRGLYDIAMMSNRGIYSCMTLERRHHNPAVIGSVIDPFTAIIYLTSGKQFAGEEYTYCRGWDNKPYGLEMIKRSIVRFVMDYNYKPSILIERPYIRNYGYTNIDLNKDDTINAFKKYIKEKTNDKYPIIVARDTAESTTIRENYFIPLHDNIKNIQQYYYPYRDSKIQFKKVDKEIAELGL